MQLRQQQQLQQGGNHRQPAGPVLIEMDCSANCVVPRARFLDDMLEEPDGNANRGASSSTDRAAGANRGVLKGPRFTFTGGL